MSDTTVARRDRSWGYDCAMRLSNLAQGSDPPVQVRRYGPCSQAESSTSAQMPRTPSFRLLTYLSLPGKHQQIEIGRLRDGEPQDNYIGNRRKWASGKGASMGHGAFRRSAVQGGKAQEKWIFLYQCRWGSKASSDINFSHHKAAEPRADGTRL